jgi:nicotinamide mononucleotide adenylyltransferase
VTVLIGCGSFSPITYLHLRMFEMARDYCQFNTSFEVIGGYLSPVGDAYKKAGLASAHHRINMCQLAVQDASSWIMGRLIPSIISLSVPALIER